MISAREVFEESRKDKYTGYFLGQVVDNADPNESYKLRVRIYPWFAEVKDANLPWIRPLDESEEHIKKLPEKNAWVWCVFRDDPMTPFWVFKHLESTAGSYKKIKTVVDAKLQALGLDSLTYPEFDIQHYGDVYIVVNSKKGEYAIINGNTAIYIDSSGKVNIKASMGSAVNINSGIGASIVLNGGKMGANDLPTCIMTGAPHCLDPLKSVKVP